MKRFLIVLVSVIHLVLIDAITKEIAAARFAEAVSVLPGFFDLALVKNYGCAWGMFQGQVWPLAVFGALALAVIIWKRREFFGEGRSAAVAEVLLYAGIVGKSPKEWRIRNMKTRWGTCNTKEGRIWLSLHLAKKHPDCLAYVIAHELTHLHVPNHSKAFWARMNVYYPCWREVRKLLNER